MKTLTSCMFDTNVFNRILDGVISFETLEGRVIAHATHVQRDELDNTENAQRRAELAKVFDAVVAGSVPTGILGAWGVASGRGEAEWRASDSNGIGGVRACRNMAWRNTALMTPCTRPSRRA